MHSKNRNPITKKGGTFQKNFFDELVIGQESQVIPAFIVEFDSGELFKLAVDYQREVPDERGILLPKPSPSLVEKGSASVSVSVSVSSDDEIEMKEKE